MHSPPPDKEQSLGPGSPVSGTLQRQLPQILRGHLMSGLRHVPAGQLNAVAWPWTKPAAELGWQLLADALGDARAVCFSTAKNCWEKSVSPKRAPHEMGG